MIEIKTELILKMFTITDMSNHIRALVAPFSKISSNLSFRNVGHPTESATINLKDDLLSITSDWNYIVVRLIGKTSNLHKKEERLRHFFDIYDRIISLESYNGLESIQLNTWDLIPNKYVDLKQFRNEFIKPSKIFEEIEINDAAITFDGKIKSSKIDFNFTFGPINFPNDIVKHNLSLFDTNVFVGMEKVEGCLVACNLSARNETFDSDILKTLLQQKEIIIKSI